LIFFPGYRNSLSNDPIAVTGKTLFTFPIETKGFPNQRAAFMSVSHFYGKRRAQ
jgi:hypothetical protein